MRSEYEINVIKTNKVWFVQDKEKDRWKRKYNIEGLFLNGKQPTKTFSKEWYQIEKPENDTLKVEHEVKGEVVNQRYEIKDKEFVSEKLPEIINYEDREKYYNEDYEGYKILDNFYDYKYDTAPNKIEEIDTEINILLELENYNLPTPFEFEATHRWGYGDKAYTITREDISHQELDRIIFPEIMLPSRPCSLSSKQIYDITRQYIKDNIDTKVAEITSDYDFCFEVKKIVPLLEPETFTYQNIFARTKKEREKIHYSTKEYKKITIYQMTHKQENYRGYTAIEPMFANSEDELKEKVNKWLKDLITMINKPLELCPYCNGTGYKDEMVKLK